MSATWCRAGRVELELLLLERLSQSERARPGRGKAEIVDLLASFAFDNEGLGQSQRAEHRGVERERAVEVAAEKVDVAESEEH